MRVVMVGNGPAAIRAIEAIHEMGDTCEITVLSPEPEQAYTPCFLSKYVAGSIGMPELVIRPADFYERHGVDFRGGAEVRTVAAEEHAVILTDGSRVAYDRLLLACGALPVIPRTTDLSGQGIAVFRTLADARSIVEQIPGVRHAIVLGSGFVAAEIAEALTEAGVRTSMVARKTRILRRIFDGEVADMVEAHMAANGVEFLKEREFTGIERDEQGRLSAIIFDGGEKVSCDFMVLAVGMRPNLDLVRGTSIASDYGILVDAGMRTSETDVYAAGDVAEVEINGVRKTNLIHPNAVATGAIAGYNMVGADKAMPSHISDMNVLNVFGRSFLSTGSLEGVRTMATRTDSGGLTELFIGEDETIVGAQLVGDVSRGGLYASLIMRRTPVDEVPELLSEHFNYAHTVGRLP